MRRRGPRRTSRNKFDTSSRSFGTSFLRAAWCPLPRSVKPPSALSQIMYRSQMLAQDLRQCDRNARRGRADLVWIFGRMGWRSGHGASIIDVVVVGSIGPPTTTGAARGPHQPTAQPVRVVRSVLFVIGVWLLRAGRGRGYVICDYLRVLTRLRVERQEIPFPPFPTGVSSGEVGGSQHLTNAGASCRDRYNPPIPQSFPMNSSGATSRFLRAWARDRTCSRPRRSGAIRTIRISARSLATND